MLNELEALARQGTPERAAVWEARLYHRVMQLVHWSHRRGDAATRRRLAASLRRLGRLRQSPLEAAAALERLARTLARRQQVALARQSRHAARLLRANQAFFQQAS